MAHGARGLTARRLTVARTGPVAVTASGADANTFREMLYWAQENHPGAPIIIKTHPEKAKQIIEPLDFLKETIPIILHHHERFDGSGYPGGLRGSSIPLGSRIVTVADTYDAITSSRAYRSARGVDAAVEELERCRGTQFDPDIVDVFAGMAVRDRFPRGGGSGATTGGREQVL